MRLMLAKVDVFATIATADDSARQGLAADVLLLALRRGFHRLLSCAGARARAGARMRFSRS